MKVVMGIVFLAALSHADVNPDNSIINKRDAEANELTSDRQALNKTDVEITRQIRQDLIADKKLSLYAHNVKIITGHGLVTLRGPVRSRTEESKVVKFAQLVAGPSHVIDKLEIAQSKKNLSNKRRVL